MLVFSYGSNMCRQRLESRAPSARFRGIGSLVGHALRFHKRSDVDGSGKADAYATGRTGDRVWGILCELDPADKEALDRAEGLGRGYTNRVVPVETPAGGSLNAHLYAAQDEWIDPDLRPLDWYKTLVVEGARQHDLPASYVRFLEGIPSDPDPDPERRERNLSVLSRRPPRS